jgi:hypothetical protein
VVGASLRMASGCAEENAQAKKDGFLQRLQMASWWASDGPLMHLHGVLLQHPPVGPEDDEARDRPHLSTPKKQKTHTQTKHKGVSTTTPSTLHSSLCVVGPSSLP